jgi:GNAT superfamily N-acetyltransferase
METSVSISDVLEEAEVVALYAANGWSAAAKPAQLLAGLRSSHTLAIARRGGALVGLGNAISDGHLVVYFPHLLVLPECQRQGIGRRLVEVLLTRYGGFHQSMLVADGGAVDFYQRMGFQRAGKTTSMWIYAGEDH